MSSSSAETATPANESQSEVLESISGPMIEESAYDELIDGISPPPPAINGVPTSQAASPESASEISITPAITLDIESNEVELPLLNGQLNGATTWRIKRFEIPDSDAASELSSPAKVTRNDEGVSPVEGRETEEVQNVEIEREDVGLKDTPITESIISQACEGATARVEGRENGDGETLLTKAEDLQDVDPPNAMVEDAEMDDEVSPATEVDKSTEAAEPEFTDAPAAQNQGAQQAPAVSPPTVMDGQMVVSRTSPDDQNVQLTDVPAREEQDTEAREATSSPERREELDITNADPPSQVKTIHTEAQTTQNGGKNPTIRPHSSNPSLQHTESKVETETGGASVKIAVQHKVKDSLSAGALSSPTKAKYAEAIPSAAAVTPSKSFTASEGLQSKDVLMAELKAMKIASLDHSFSPPFYSLLCIKSPH
jgi:hypothetical protein